MPSQLETQVYIKPEEYLAAELRSEQKHEYLAGIVYAMAGTSVRHNRITDNISRQLGNQREGSGCDVFSMDIKVPIRKGAAEFYYYPDVIVDCSSPPDTSYYSEEPSVIFEVLSPETERIDRGEKLQNYQTLPSLRAYVLVDQSRLAVTVYRPRDGNWEMEILTGKEDVLILPEIECQLPLRSIYERTDLIR